MNIDIKKLKDSMFVYQMGYVDNNHIYTLTDGTDIYVNFTTLNNMEFEKDVVFEQNLKTIPEDILFTKGGGFKSHLKCSLENMRSDMTLLYDTRRLEDEFIDTHTPAIGKFLIPGGSNYYMEGNMIVSDTLIYTGRAFTNILEILNKQS